MIRPSSFRESNPLKGRASSFGLFRGSVGLKRPTSRMSVGGANSLWKATDPTDQVSKSPEASPAPPVVRVIEMTEVVANANANGDARVIENPLFAADQEQRGRTRTRTRTRTQTRTRTRVES